MATEQVNTHPSLLPRALAAEVQPNYYVVRDADGQQLAYNRRPPIRRM